MLIARVLRHAPYDGLLGRPVSHSLSTAMHNAALAALEADAVYLPLAGRIDGRTRTPVYTPPCFESEASTSMACFASCTGTKRWS